MAGFTLVTQATLLTDVSDRFVAWAEHHVRKDPDLGWILANFVEADNANLNGHIFPLGDLKDAHPSVVHKPLNILHQQDYVVGTYVASKLVDEDGESITDDDEESRPHVQTLAAFWKHNFPQEYELVDRAFREGKLLQSQECICEKVEWPDHGGVVTAFAGARSETYPTDDPRARKILHRPHFAGGGLILPPAKAGWPKAITRKLDVAHGEGSDEAQALYEVLAAIAPNLDEAEREYMVAELFDRSPPGVPDGMDLGEGDAGWWRLAMDGLLVEAEIDAYMDRDFSVEKRKEYAKQGIALDDGSYPIPDKDALRRAILAYGRSNPSDRAKVKRHIIKRARALGAADMLPDDWT